MRKASISLVVATLAAALASVGPRAATSSLQPVADAYVTAGSPKANFGTSTELEAGASPDTRSYLRFDLTSVRGKIRSATLRIYSNSASSVGYDLRSVAKNFNERSITYQNAPPVSATITSSSGAVAVGWISLDATSLVAAGTAVTIAVTSSSATTLSFASRETSGLAPTLDVVVDTTPPVVTLESPANGRYVNSATPTFSGTAGTAVGDAATVSVAVYAGATVSGKPLQTLTATRDVAGTYSATAASPLADGTYTAQASQADDAGNTGLSSADTFVVDTVAPAVTLSAPANGSATSNPAPTFTGTASAGAGDLSQVTVKIYSGGSAAGSPLQTLVATRGSSGTYSVAASALADGTYTAQAEQTDAAGNVGRSAPSTFTVDTTGPTTTITSGPADPTNSSSATFAFVANEASSSFACRLDGAAFTACSSPVSYGPLAAGSHTFDVRATDGLGNTGAVAERTWAIDTTAPVVTLTTPSGGSTVTTRSPVFSGAAGTLSGDSTTVTVKVYSGTAAVGTPVEVLSALESAGSYSVTASPPLDNATYTAQAEQMDAAGNTGRSSANTFTVNGPDTTPPAVTLVTPADGSATNHATPTFSGVAGTATGDSSTVTVRVYAGSAAAGTPLQTLTTLRQGSAYAVGASSPLQDGAYTAQAEQLDAAGNVGRSSPNTFTVDTVAPPVPTIDSGPTSLSGSSVAFAFSDAQTGVAFRCAIDGGAASSCSSPTSYTGLADGSHIFAVTALDAAGNESAAASRTWTVDGTAPLLTLVSPANGSSTQNTTPQFSGAAGTAAGDSGTITVRVYGGTSPTGTPVETLTAPVTNGSYAVTASPALQLGTYTAQAEQADAAGNVGRSGANTFSITADAVLLAAGDIANCSSSGDEATAAILDANPGVAVQTIGDNAYPSGLLSDFTNCYDPSWGRAKDRTRPALGPHDYGDVKAGDSTGYFTYFQQQLAPFGPSASDPNRGYYSYDLGAWHVVVLNSDCNYYAPACDQVLQEQWLRADLAAHPAACTLAIEHIPRYSSGSVHGSDTGADGKSYWDALYENGADVVLAGDDHDYERFAPQDTGGGYDPSYGIREFVVGTGGSSHYTFGTIQPNSEVRNSDTFGVLKLTLHAGSYDWRFLPEAGKTFGDSGSGTCHGTPPPPPPPTPVVRSFSSNSVNGATSFMLDKPAATQPGDLLLAIVAHQGGSNKTMTPPAGWTAVPNTDFSDGTNARIHAWYRFPAADDPASYTFAIGGVGVDTAGGMLDIAGARASAPINASGGQANGSTAATSVAAPSVTTTVANTLLVFGGACNVAVYFAPPYPMIESWDRSTSGEYRVSNEVAWQGFAATGATGTRTATASSTCRSVADVVAVAPQ